MNRRHYLTVLLCLFATLLLSACSEKSPDPMDTSSAQEHASQAQTEPASEAVLPERSAPQTTAPEVSGTGEKVDVDLTQMSSTMVYSEVYNIMVNPADYIGKTIKIRGQYDVTYYEEMKKYYHYVVIADATACCQQGLEFIWNGQHTYPDDYPEKQAEIEIVGVFNRYEELGQTYYYLLTNNIII